MVPYPKLLEKQRTLDYRKAILRNLKEHSPNLLWYSSVFYKNPMGRRLKIGGKKNVWKIKMFYLCDQAFPVSFLLSF